MSGAYPVLIVVTVFHLALGSLFLYSAVKAKWKEKYLIYSALLCLATAIFVVIGMVIKSEKISIAGWIIPFGLFLLLTALQTPFNFKKCTTPVTAEYISFDVHSHKGITNYFPEFSYNYNGEEFIKNKSFVYYSKRKILKLFKTGENYTIFIDPEKPKLCADKRHFPYLSTIGLSLFSLFGIVMGVLCLFLMK